MLNTRRYNAFGQLISLWKDETLLNYTYRPDKLRHSTTVRTSANPAITTLHHWDGQNMILETENGRIKGKYVRGASLIAQVIDLSLFYYLLNAHGDVIQRVGANGEATPQYKYDAFGNQREEVETDPNPFRYCGEYWDRHAEEVYLRARTYNPANGRFTQEDVAKSGNNWYGYGANNPIKYFDSSGMIIQLVGTQAEQDELFANLQMLTDDTLAVDENGVVYVVQPGDGDLSTGTALVSDCINSHETITIIQAPVGSSVTQITPGETTIYLDPNQDTYVPTVNPETGLVTGYEETPIYIVLGHELIHAYNGTNVPLYATDYKFVVGYREVEHSFLWWTWTTQEPIYQTEKDVHAAELETVGLIGKNKYTENMLRAEHGINLRGAYHAIPDLTRAKYGGGGRSFSSAGKAA